jgi:two-component system KDP operon response regulator KdpE
MNKQHILVVDDDQSILKFLSANLKARGYEVTTAMDGEKALAAVEQEMVDLIILDIMLPRMDGVEVCRRVREWSQVPIIMLTARGDEKFKVNCLDLGADDYLTKPFGVGELMARIKTAFRHFDSSKSTISQSVFRCGALEINFAMRKVTVNGNEVQLTPTEYSLLQQLVVNADKVLTHRMLLQSVWGNQYGLEREYLRVFVNRLRRKLESEVASARHIITVPGVGYRFATAQ